jgi:hypothetical protein
MSRASQKQLSLNRAASQRLGSPFRQRGRCQKENMDVEGAI